MATKSKNVEIADKTKLYDLPCFYFATKYGTRADQISTFCLMASYYGLSLEEACANSNMFATLGIFNYEPIKKEELTPQQISYFTKHGKSCSTIQGRSFSRKNNINENCCIVCEFYSGYCNNNKSIELKILHRIYEGSDIGTYVTSNQFRCCTTGAGGNNVVEYPPFPIHRYLFDYMMGGGKLDDTSELVEKVMEHIKLSYPDVNPQYVVNCFSAAIKSIINKTGIDVEDSLLVKELQTSKYSPTKICRPVSEENKNEPKFKQTSFFTTLADENESFDRSEREKDIHRIGKNFIEETSVENADEEPADKLTEDTEDIVVSVGSDAPVENIQEEPSDITTDANKYDVDEDFEEDIILVSVNSDDAPTEHLESADKEEIPLPVFEGDEEDVIVTVPKATEVNEAPDTVIEDVGDVFKSSDDISEEEAESETAADYENISKPVYNLPLSIVSPCEVCFFENNFALSRSVYESELVTANGDERLEQIAKDKISYFEKITGKDNNDAGNTYMSLRTWIGCGLIKKHECAFDCPFSSRNFVSKEFAPYILDVSDGTKEIFDDFLLDLSIASDVSVEAVVYNYIEGLLFYLNGKFYFFNHRYGYSGYLRSILTNTDGCPTYYSANPVKVHAIMRELRVPDIKIESVCALFSVYHGVYTLAPVSVIFDKYVRKPVMTDDFYMCAMPVYPELVKDLKGRLESAGLERYQNGMRLEKALGRNYYISDIAREDVNILGGNFIQYGFALANKKRPDSFLCPGTRFKLTLTDIERLFTEDSLRVKFFFEKTAGDLYAPSNSYLDSAHLILLWDNVIEIYVTEEANALYDNLLQTARKNYISIFKEPLPKINISKTVYAES